MKHYTSIGFCRVIQLFITCIIYNLRYNNVQQGLIEASMFYNVDFKTTLVPEGIL